MAALEAAASIYIHDPGERYNARAMADPREGWNNTNHNWCVAYWLHQGLLRYRRRVHDVEEADAVFIALYGQYHNPKSDYLHFGRAMYDWPQVLRQGPPPSLQRRAAPAVEAATRLHGCRGLRVSVPRPELPQGRAMDHPQRSAAASSATESTSCRRCSPAEWRPPDDDDVVVDEEERRRGSAGPRFFLLYIGKVCKPYIEPPASTLRFALWSVLRAHPNATFWATDHLWQASLNASDPAATPPCRQCSYGCKQCLRLPAESAHVSLSVGLLGRRMDPHEYLGYMRNATFCVVARGDNEMTRKFTEAIVAGCIPVMIVDMPALPFERRLDYAAFSYEFDLKKVLERPMLVMETLLRVPAAEVRAKRRALLRVRRHSSTTTIPAARARCSSSSTIWAPRWSTATKSLRSRASTVPESCAAGSLSMCRNSRSTWILQTAVHCVSPSSEQHLPHDVGVMARHRRRPSPRRCTASSSSRASTAPQSWAAPRAKPEVVAELARARRRRHLAAAGGAEKGEIARFAWLGAVARRIWRQLTRNRCGCRTLACRTQVTANGDPGTTGTRTQRWSHHRR